MTEPERSTVERQVQPPLLATKLFVPPARKGLVARPRLVQRLAEALDGPLTLVSAPAGCGKTTLLAEWRQSDLGRDLPLAWLSLDPDDSDPVRFWAYLVAALRAVEPSLGEDLLALLHSSPPPPTSLCLSLLVGELAGLDRELVLALDDYHVVDSRAVHEALAQLVEHMPPSLHLVILTRVDPPWPLSRWRARGVVSDVRGIDLQFGPLEVEAFLRQVAKLDLSTEDVSVLGERTEGWVVGLQLAALSLRGRDDPSVFVQSFAGTDRYVLDFLADEVLARQPEEVQSFLLETSILDRFSALLAGAVTQRGDGEEMIERLERDNLFVVPLDERREWYRYHHLFRDLLRARLKHSSPDRLGPLYSRAAEWCEVQGYVDEAIGYALAGENNTLAGRLVEAHVREAVQRGELGVVLRWFKGLPRHVVLSSPVLAVSYCWALWLNGQVAALESQLEAARQAVEAAPQEATEDGLQAEVATLRAFLARAQGDLEGAVRLAEEASRLADGREGFLGTVVAYALATAYHGLGDVERAIPAYQETVRLARAESNATAALGTSFHLARLLRSRGRLREAAETCRGALRFAEAQGWARLPSCGLVHLALADVLCEWDDLDGAEMHLETGRDLGRHGGEGDAVKHGGAVGARVLRARGDARGALEVVQQAESEIERLDGWLKSAELADEQARAWLALGDVRRAAECVDEAARRVGLDRHYTKEMLAATSARVRLAEGDPQEAIDLLSSGAAAAEVSGQAGLLIELLALQARAYQALGRQEEALAMLGRALVLAEPEGYVRVFLDEGEAMEKPLRRGLERRAWASPSVVVRYASGLLSRHVGPNDAIPSNGKALGDRDGSSGSGITEPLSERELEVLRLLAAGLSNADIADRLVITTGTVKAHVHRIYGKLGVEGRVPAVVRARELRLLKP